MNFTQEIKRDLMRSIPEERSFKCALLAAGLVTSGEQRAEGFSFTSENEATAAYLLKIVEEVFGVQMTVTEAVKDPKHGRDKLTFSYLGKNAGEFAAELAAHSAARLDSQGGYLAYLKGAFLGSGSCTLPRGGRKTGYHLEFVFREREQAEDFCELLDKLQLMGSVLARGDKFVAYSNRREAISDFLSVMGASSALRTLDSVSAAREESNNENRVSNCYASNVDKAAIASAAQIVALDELEKSGVLATLPDALRVAARARTENPSLSLSELAVLLGVTKSCLNHRMRKLMQIYGEKMQ